MSGFQCLMCGTAVDVCWSVSFRLEKCILVIRVMAFSDRFVSDHGWVTKNWCSGKDCKPAVFWFVTSWNLKPACSRVKKLQISTKWSMQIVEYSNIFYLNTIPFYFENPIPILFVLNPLGGIVSPYKIHWWAVAHGSPKTAKASMNHRANGAFCCN